MFACTAKLDLGSYARVLYDWEGKELNSLSDGVKIRYKITKLIFTF